MTRRDRLVELACLWQEIRADRPPMRRLGGGQTPASPCEDPTRKASIGLRPGDNRTVPFAWR
ncbi:MAG TPA: hypothetical protein VMA77_28470 [Solirubrobacteraceae bacterium]|nr:hypothetical protein [Solirubrobacteraceae bacterium]